MAARVKRTDTLSPSQRSERMSRIHSKDTGPEMTVRRMVHAMGFRYRLHQSHLPGSPDLVFPARKRSSLSMAASGIGTLKLNGAL